ncbi:Copine-8 [Chamberlinius hualienensis]
MDPRLSAHASTFQPGSAAMSTSVVELRIACRNVKDMDVFSKSDPMCVVFVKNPHTGIFAEAFRTEVIKDTINPDFVKQMTIEYNFEVQQILRFDIYDSDSAYANLDHHDYLGRMECSLGEIIAAQGNQFKRNLSGRGKCGTIIVYAEEVTDCKKSLKLQFAATKLDKKDFFSKSDPFLIISKFNEDASTVVVHKTEVIKKNLNPTWNPFEISLRVLCGGDLDRTIKIQCYDYDRDGTHDLIGEVTTNVRTLMKGAGPDTTFNCINPKKKAKKKSYKHSGLIRVVSCVQYEENTFLDYITRGTQLHFTVAIDFTSSNGDPKSPNSLHFINPSGQPNPYMIAIRSVGDIIADYDSDKQFPALGFGAKLPPHGDVSHEFFLNGNPANPYCNGVDGILQSYFSTITSVQLYGPTNFSPVIRHVARFAEAIRDGSGYFILLIITDGAITDMQETKRSIIRASSLPLSIIIVGVGSADFNAMEELDSDRSQLSCDGQVAERDIVQFVPLRDFIIPNVAYHETQARLAKVVLAEVPSQVTSFMKRHNVKPRS